MINDLGRACDQSSDDTTGPYWTLELTGLARNRFSRFYRFFIQSMAVNKVFGENLPLTYNTEHRAKNE